MKKITLLLLFLFLSVSSYSQLYNQTEGFENPGPLGPLPSTWDLGTGTWAVFERNTPSSVGTAESWGVNAFATGLQYEGNNCASVNRELMTQNATSEDFLATSVISVPAAGSTEMHFWTRLFTSGNQGTIFKVMVAPAVLPQSDPDSYTDYLEWSELSLIVPTSNFNVWTEKTVDLTPYAGFDIYVAFVRVFTQPSTGVDGDRWLIDSVGVYSPCTPPVTGTTTSITSNSANLTWSNPSGANQWVVTMTPVAGGTPIVHTFTGPIPSGGFLFDGLSPNTQYNYTVQAVCDSGFSSDPSNVSANFTTQVAPPVCGGNLVDSGGISGNYGNNENSTLTVCPTTAGDLVTVTFTAFNTQAGSDFLKIYDGTGTTGTLLANLSGTTVPPSYTATAADGCLTFNFTSNASTVAAGYAANITCGPPPACRIPTAFAAVANSATTNTVTFSWQQPANPDASVATEWQVIALPCGSPAPGANPTTGIIVTATTNSDFVFPGLTPATCYDFYVRANCATNSSWFPIPVSVTTLVAPPVCGGNFVDTGGISGNYSNNATNLTSVICPTNTGDAVTVTFTSFNTQAGNDILTVYDGNGTVGTTLLANLSGTTLPPAFTSTATNGCLTFVFNSNATTTAAGWVANVTCAPPAACAAPTSLVVNGTPTHNTAVLSWAQAANPDTSVPSSWQLIAVPCGSPVPGVDPPGNAIVTTANTNTNFPFTGLTPNSCLTIYVRAICGATFSAWNVLPVTVNTLIAPPECGGNFADAGGTTGGYAANSNVTTIICPTNPGDVVTVTFTAFNTEATFDALYVYNGNAVVPANLIPSNNGAGSVPGGLAGGYWGTAIPCPFTSSTPDGCLTFVFRSDGSVQNPGWLANVTCAPPPVCSVPTGITASAITHNSVTLNWTQPANPDSSVASMWDVLVLPCGSPAPTAASTGFTTITTAPPFVLNTGLNPATCYDIYVRANCGATTSAWPCSPTTITTLAAPPVCGGNFVDAGGTTGPYAVNSNVTTTICPTNPGDVVTVTFTSFNTEATFDALYVYNGSTVVPANIIPSTNGAGNVPGGVAGGYWGTTLPCPFTSASSDGCLTFVFRSDGSVQNPGWVANITCGPPAACAIPSQFAGTNVTHNSVVLNWTQPANADTSVATSWDILPLACGAPAPAANATGFTTISNPPTSAPPYTLQGLTPSTCYDIYIRANCGGTTSAWVCRPVTITTLVAPPECGGTFTDAGGPNGAYANNSNITTYICPSNPGEIVTVTFTSFNTEANWDGLYVYDGNTVTPAALLPSANGAGNVPGGLAGSYWGNLTGNNLPGPFTSTDPSGCLTFVFRSDGSGTNPGWVANVTCAPAPTCLRPALITAFPVTQTSATLNWTQFANPDGSTATSWEVLVLPAGSPVPTGPGIPVSITDNPSVPPYIANGLAPGTQYVFYVRAICSPTDASDWSAFVFATQPVNDECANATFAIVNQNLNCVQTTHGTLAGATASSPATTCGGAGAANDDVWFTFTATAPTHIISFNNVTPNTALSYAIYQGTCTGLTQVGCNEGDGLVAGTTYYIRVFSDGTAPVLTNFDLCIGTLPCTEAPAFCTGQTVTYANSTNVPSLGQIGCLFTSPNPAFFFLQVNQAGPLSYLISQVDNGGVGRDVDYVAWGPFTDLNTACTGVPSNPLTQTVPIPTPATGCPGTLHACSYSTAPQEIMCIPNAQLCDVYVIMITNFSNQAGTVTFTQTNTGGGTTACFPINTFNYSQTYYCQNQPNPTPVLSPGATAGTYTSTPGLVIDPVTGTINLAASTPGAYVITSTSETTVGGTCNTIPFITTTRTVIITAPADATIVYPHPTYCNSITTMEPITRTGTTGGTYSASPAGLLLNATTGEILPIASTPGVYTVTYTVPASGGCDPFTTTTQVEILAAPVIAQANVTACDTFTLPALPDGAAYYTQPNGQGTPLDPSVEITTTTNPIYIFATATNGCTTEKQFSVTINTVPEPTFEVTQSTCTTSTGSVTVTSPIAPGVGVPSDLFISEVTDADSGSLTYVEIYNATGAPVNLANYKLKFYTWGSPPTTENLQCDLQLSGTIANNTTNVIKVSNSANAAGVTPNQTFTGCAGVNNNDNIRLTTSADVLVDQWGPTDGSTFTPAGQTGYTYRRLNTAALPSTTWDPADWTTTDPEDYTNVGTYSITVSNYQYSLDGGPFQSAVTFENVAPGDHELVVRDVLTGCESDPVQVIIDAVGAVPSVTTFTYTTPVCQNATTNPLPDTSATGFTTGGTFTSNPLAGIDLNPTTGEINLASTTAGSYDITYTIPFDPVTCQSFSSTTFTIVITNVSVPVVGFSYTTPICQNAQASLAPTLDAGFTTGGEFSSTTGLVIDDTTGVIDLATSTPGSYTITYTFAGNTCLPQSVGTFDIVINPGITPVTTIAYTTPVCAFSTTNPVPDTSATDFTAGGTYSANPSTGIDINPTTGEINLAGSTAGSYEIRYDVPADPATCRVAGFSTTTIVIDNVIPAEVGFTYTTPVCQIAQPTLAPTLATGFVLGGTFTINPSTGATIDQLTGVITLGASMTAGTYEVTYSIGSDVATCRDATTSLPVQVVIDPVTNANVSFTYPTPVCMIGQSTIVPTLDPAFTTGGTFTANPSQGIAIDATTGVITLSNNATAAGSYSITYTVAQNLTTCQALTTSSPIQIVITPATNPTVGFHYDTPVCANEATSPMPILDAGFVTGGTFSPTNIVDADTGEVDLNVLTAGQDYTITYTLAADMVNCQNAGTSTATIRMTPPILVELNGGCQNKYILNVAPVNGSFDPATATFSWENAQGDVVGTTQSIIVTAIGNYTVTVTSGGCSTESAPFEVTSVNCQIQKGISANNDNFNDTFDLTGFDVKKLTIFNRYGAKVYSRANYVNEWDGKSDDGDELPDGTYFYVIDKNVGDSVTGWIYINRAQ